MPSDSYMPILKWRQGEYQALFRLPSSVKDLIVPMIEIPPVEWDFETATRTKSVQEHTSRFSTRLKEKWGERPAFIDFVLLGRDARMNDGSHPLLAVLMNAASAGCVVVPVTAVDRDEAYQDAVGEIASRVSGQICLRISMDDWADPLTVNKVRDLLRRFRLDANHAHIVLDLGAPNFSPLGGFTKFLSAIYPPLATTLNWRSITVAGTAFPKSMGELTEEAQLVTRYEWLAYRELLHELERNVRAPSFGDYAIAHPALPQEDMRILRPSATIRYTVKDSWYVIKGRNVRDHGFSQYAKHCREIAASKHFLGAHFCEGDKYISDCAKGLASTGNLTTWRWVGTNHHLTVLTRDLANVYA